MLRYRDFFPLAADTDANAGTGHGIPLGDALPLGILVTDREGKCLYADELLEKADTARYRIKELNQKPVDRLSNWSSLKSGGQFPA